MMMLKKLKSFLTAKTRRGLGQSDRLNQSTCGFSSSTPNEDGNIRSSRALEDANDVAKLLIKMHEARLSSDYLTANNSHLEDEPVGSTGNNGPFGSKLSVSRLSPVPIVVKAFRRISGGSTTTTATTATSATNVSGTMATTDATTATRVANASTRSIDAVDKAIRVEGKSYDANDSRVSPAYESNLTPLELSALEFSEPAVIPALCLPFTIDNESCNGKVAAVAAAAGGPRRSSRISVFEVLANWSELSNTSAPDHGENGLPVPPNSPCTPVRGCDLLHTNTIEEYRSLKPWGRRRIRSLPELEDLFRPLSTSADHEADDIFGPIILLAPASPSRRTHNRAVSLGAATSNVIAKCGNKAYELADPRIYPKDSCFTTGDTCPCLPTLVRSSTMPISPISEKNTSLTAYLADLARELNDMSRSSSPSPSPSILEARVLGEDSIFSDLTSSVPGLAGVGWVEGHTSLSIGGYWDPSEDVLPGGGRLLTTVSLPVMTLANSLASISQSVTASIIEQEEVQISRVSNCLQLDTGNESLVSGFRAVVAHDTFGPGSNILSDVSLASNVPLDTIPAHASWTEPLTAPDTHPTSVSASGKTDGRASSLVHNLAELEISPSMEASLASLTQQLQDTVSGVNDLEESSKATVPAIGAKEERRRTRTEGWIRGGTRQNVLPSRIPRMTVTTLPLM